LEKNWMTQHMHGVLLTIEVFWVAGVLAIFVFYFAVKRRVRARRRQEAAEAAAQERKMPRGGRRPTRTTARSSHP